jgi:hypothetical protein
LHVAVTQHDCGTSHAIGQLDRAIGHRCVRTRNYPVRMKPRISSRGELARIASVLARRAPLFSAVFVVGAVFHSIALAWPRASDASPAWRHVLFLAINVSFAVAFAVRWRGVLIPCVVLAAQQSFSHGMDFVRAARAGEWDFPSLAVLLVLPWLLLAAIGIARGPRR